MQGSFSFKIPLTYTGPRGAPGIESVCCCPPAFRQQASAFCLDARRPRATVSAAQTYLLKLARSGEEGEKVQSILCVFRNCTSAVRPNIAWGIERNTAPICAMALLPCRYFCCWSRGPASTRHRFALAAAAVLHGVIPASMHQTRATCA